MKIKSTVLQVLAAASLGAGLLYAMGIEGGAQLGPALDAHSIQQACAQTGGCQHLQNGGFDFHAVSPFSTAGKKYSPICSCGMCSSLQMAVIS